jgi:uncharacterized protein (DUF433 family)
MAALDWSECDAVERIAGKVSGAWLFRDTRMPVSIVFDNLQAGATVEEIMEWFDVSREQMDAVLEFIARSLEPLAQSAQMTEPMLFSFDHSTPAPLRRALQIHTVVKAADRGWDRLINGDLLQAAGSAGFEVFITADKNLRYQQNLSSRCLVAATRRGVGASGVTAEVAGVVGG